MDLSAAARLPSVPATAGTKTEVWAQPTIRTGSDASDEALIARIRPGDQEATALLFQRYAQLVRVVSLRILRDEAEADDLVQDLFLFLHKNAGIYDSSKSTPRSWLVQMTYRRAISRRRYLTARGHYKNEELNCCVPGYAGVVTPAYDSSIEALFGREGLKKVMGELTAEQHETLRLHFYEGYTLAEIGKKLGQSVGNVRHYYYRGLEKLRKQVRESKLQNR
ncbi:MAG: sigma-70 family RNA polymerase sigma factor [Candidatus Acidiferrum sp.]